MQSGEYGRLLLSKAIDENNLAIFTREGITEKDFPTADERNTYRFVVSYAEKNQGAAPSYATVAAEVPGFENIYVPHVSDHYDYLAEQVKGYAAKNWLVELVNGKIDDKTGKPVPGQLAEKLNEFKNGNDLLKWLRDETESAIMRTNVRKKIGTDIKTDAEKFLAEYDRRKTGESFRTWKSKFSIIGEYVSSNVYTVFGKSGRGKSVITLEDAIHMAMQGANVLIWAMEMGWFEVLVRIYVSISGEKGYTTAHTHGMDLAAGFDSTQVRHAKLPPEFDVAFRAFVDSMNEIIPGNITVRAVDDPDFNVRTLRALEADIQQTKADVVVLDPFYYLDYEKNTSKTAGGDAAETSKKLRGLAGRTQTVVFAITQADETDENETDEGDREIELPKRKHVSKTKQLLQDAYLLIGVDTNYKQGRGLIGINKGRDGGEGDSTEILYIPSVGVVREMETGEAAASQFEF